MNTPPGAVRRGGLFFSNGHSPPTRKPGVASVGL